MSSPVAVVTGGNKGIGFAIVKGLCQKFNGIVYLTARDEERGKNAIADLQKIGLTPRFHQLDVDNLDSIKKFKEYIQKEHGGLDVLVNNAAMAYKVSSPAPFAEQAENTIRVNFFALLNICRELFPLLKPHARVVNLSSSAGKLSIVPSKEKQDKFLSPNLTEEELCNLMNEFVEDAKSDVHKQKGWPNSAYGMSKVGVTALTFIQQRAFDKDSREDLIANSVHPGYVDTDMTSHHGVLTIEQGAEAPLHLALLPPNVSSPKGQYIWNDKTIASWL